jgi:hypothetical protein
MKLPQVVLLCGLSLICGTALAQPDYTLHATPIGPAPVDPAIARALPQHIVEHGNRSAARPGD